ncbi:hypothetical protein [Methylomonas sp. HYX-M1]|uniref:hypothetical protein n=1 Tax=Methylomonas sp. HYX-M1 TaxID=3139307 RepID=UPI00345C564A
MNLQKVCLAGLLSMAATCAQAATLTADGAWYAFDVDEWASLSGGLEWIDLDGAALSFDFNLTAPAYLRVVDAGFAGDRFQVFDNGDWLGETSVPAASYPDSVAADFDAAYANTAYSRAVYWLDAGSHSISGLLSGSATDDSGLSINATLGAVSVTAVPVPAAVWLFGAGLGLLSGVSRGRIGKR